MQRTCLQNLTTLHQRLPTRAESMALVSGVYLPKASQGPRTKQGTPPKLKARRHVNRRDSQHSSLSFNIQLPLPAHLFSVSKQAVRLESIVKDFTKQYNYASQQYHKSKLISESYICRSSLYIFISVVGQSPVDAHCKSSELALWQALPLKQSFIATATLSPQPNYIIPLQ
ncbi:uncharacterized protein LACBIDRAFT_334581 [Laccaria bicolor S238N-H82]|uniref:Predicted protein n=1 Tax=Laccaria bicolor (strain S238N-H82 / ATCC MYA-4686) TaxID=486041 RepID=B0DZK0_LACBS|nr:uncharacterized protein LACBIDRAFT_334581 [Laccaria bicolor S238N-H82]EDQ99952.1 predicted protein [Laccaria bicolor S238N-H82]|eukprot:XP_001889363.1 predicted protein [Laccaria bicolor S238N-H82]